MAWSHTCRLGIRNVRFKLLHAAIVPNPLLNRSLCSLPLAYRSTPIQSRHLTQTNHCWTAKRHASGVTPHSTAADPAETEAVQCLEKGTQKLEEGDVHGAKELYKRSAEMRRDAGALFNLGVTHYHLKEYDEAIGAWKESISLQPSSPDAHTNLASAYIISPISRPDLALHHLKIAADLAPNDPEIAFNLGVVLEACGHLEEALTQYMRSENNGISRASMHARNVKAKILGNKIRDMEDAKEPKP